MRAPTVRLAVAAGGVVSLLWAAPADRGDAADRRIMALPIGLSGVKAEGLSNRAYISRVLDDMRAMGINTVHPNNLDFDHLSLWIELCRERGMRLIPEGGQFMRDYYMQMHR